MASFASRGGWWVAAQIAVLAACLAGPPILGDFLRWPGGSWRSVLGGALGIAGLTLFGAGAVSLGNALTPMPAPKEPAALRTCGAYAFVRHPIYGGIVLELAGYGLASSSILALAVPVAAFVFFDRKASFEETLLRTKHVCYSDYAGRTRKLIPWLY